MTAELVRVDKLSFSYGSTQVLAGLDVEFGTGIHGLLGPNGAGKTTLLSILATQRRAQAGELNVLGQRIKNQKDALIARRNIGYLPQNPGLFQDFTITEMVSYVATLRGLERGEIAASVKGAIELVDLGARSDHKIKRLSGGMKQRAALACAFVGRPRFLILDEPTVGLDPNQRLELKQVLRDYGEAVILLSTHIVDDVGAIAKTVAVMVEGKIMFSGPREGLAELGTEQYPGDSALERGYMRLLLERQCQ